MSRCDVLQSNASVHVDLVQFSVLFPFIIYFMSCIELCFYEVIFFPDYYLQIRALNTAKYKMQSYSSICKRLFHTAFISVMEAAIMNIFLNLHVHIRHCYHREHAYICGRKLVIKITDDIFLHASTEYYQSKLRF